MEALWLFHKDLLPRFLSFILHYRIGQIINKQSVSLTNLLELKSKVTKNEPVRTWYSSIFVLISGVTKVGLSCFIVIKSWQS